MRTAENYYRQYFIDNYFDPSTDIPKIQELLSVQEVIFEILTEFVRICKAHHVRFFPLFGTMLGTVRHQGIIPWDDDVDLCMFRKDYEYILEVFKTELKGEYEVIDLTKDRHCYRGSYLRLSKIDSTAIELNKHWGEETCHGIWIDILPLDNMFEDDKKNQLKIHQVRYFQHLLRAKAFKYKDLQNIYNKRDYKQFQKDAEKYSVSELQAKITSLAKEGPSKLSKVALLVDNGVSHEVALWDIENFNQSEYMKFAKFQFQVPKNYRRILENNYGLNYMKYPPIDQRRSHHRRFYSTSLPYETYRKRFFIKDMHLKEPIVLFGSGRIALNFLKKYEEVCKPAFIVDNDVNKQGKRLKEISLSTMKVEEEFKDDEKIILSGLGELQVKSPKALLELGDKHVNVIICSSYFKEIGEQLLSMGIEEYYIHVQKKEWL